MIRFVSETFGVFRNLKVWSPMKDMFHTLQEATQSVSVLFHEGGVLPQGMVVLHGSHRFKDFTEDG